MAKRGVAYKPRDADRVFVDRAVMAGTPINDIAAALNLSKDTLNKHYRYEISTARERLKGEAVRVITESLADGSLDAAKYVMARVGGWREQRDLNVEANVKRELPSDRELGRAILSILGSAILRNDDVVDAEVIENETPVIGSAQED